MIIAILLTLVVAVPVTALVTHWVDTANAPAQSLADVLVAHTDPNGNPCFTAEDTNHDTGYNLEFVAPYGVDGTSVTYTGKESGYTFPVANAKDIVEVRYHQKLTTPSELAGHTPCFWQGRPILMVESIGSIYTPHS